MLKWGASQALWSQRNIFMINFFFSVQQMQSTLILSFGEGTCLQLDFLPHRQEVTFGLDSKTCQRVICTHHCWTEALLCCWDSLMLLFQLQLSLRVSFLDSDVEAVALQVCGRGRAQGPSGFTVKDYNFFSPLCPTNAVWVKAVIKSTLILSFEKQALQLAFLPETGEDFHLLWTK